MNILAPVESSYKELTDEQCFRQMIESFAEMRSKNEKRKFPRFPTPAALSGKLGAHGFEGILVCEEGESTEYLIKSDGKAKGPERTDDRIRKINVVDFSEDGLQLSLRCNDLMHLQGSSVYLEVQNFRLPVRFKWYRQSGFDGEGGFSFLRKIDTDQYLARFISTLNTKLIYFLIREYKQHPITFTRQAGIFIYFSILYGLRLKFLEVVAEINDLKNTAQAQYPSGVQKALHQSFQDFNYSNAYHRQQISRNMSDPRLKKLLHLYIKPFYTFGCGIPAMRQSVVFLRDDAWATILNSVFFAKEDRQDSAKILPSLLSLYQSFQHLQQLLPGVFEQDEIHNQFRHYSKIIFDMELLRERVVDYLSSQREDLTSQEESVRLEAASKDQNQRVSRLTTEVPALITENTRKRFFVLLLTAGVIAASFFAGLWLGKSAGNRAGPQLAEKDPSAQVEPIKQPLDKMGIPALKGDIPPVKSEIQQSGETTLAVPNSESTKPGQTTGGSSTSESQKNTGALTEAGPNEDKGEQETVASEQFKNHTFEVEADQEAWVQVKIDKRSTQSALLKPGEKRVWEAKQSIQIVLGNAGGVRMKWDGVALGSIGKRGERVRFLLPNPKYTGPR